MRRQFSSAYEQTISLIKQLKNSNDHLNRAIGVDTSTIITARLKRQQPIIENTTSRIDGLIQKLEQSYLDPDTARKIGTAKQQFRIQRDRRNQLLLSANYEQTPTPERNESANHELPSMQSVITEPEPSRSHLSTWSRFTHKESETTHQNSTNQKEEEQEIEFEMERKLMHERNQEIDIVARSIMNVHNIIQESGVLVDEQGDQLDIIGEEMFTTYRNVDAARENISEANDHQQRARRKYITLSLLLLLVMAVGAIIVFV